jgi:hypothetical protein
VPTLAEVMGTILSDTAEGGLLDVMEATSSLAGIRSAYVGVVLPLGADNDVWIGRVQRRAQAVRRVLLASARNPGNAKGIGAIAWPAITAILADAAQSDALPAAECGLADRAVRWMRERLTQGAERDRLA